MPSIRTRMEEIGTDLVAHRSHEPRIPQEFVASEIQEWAAPITASGVSVD